MSFQSSQMLTHRALSLVYVRHLLIPPVIYALAADTTYLPQADIYPIAPDSAPPDRHQGGFFFVFHFRLYPRRHPRKQAKRSVPCSVPFRVLALAHPSFMGVGRSGAGGAVAAAPA